MVAVCRPWSRPVTVRQAELAVAAHAPHDEASALPADAPAAAKAAPLVMPGLALGELEAARLVPRDVGDTVAVHDEVSADHRETLEGPRVADVEGPVAVLDHVLDAEAGVGSQAQGLGRGGRRLLERRDRCGSLRRPEAGSGSAPGEAPSSRLEAATPRAAGCPASAEPRLEVVSARAIANAVAPLASAFAFICLGSPGGYGPTSAHGTHPLQSMGHRRANTPVRISPKWGRVNDPYGWCSIGNPSSSPGHSPEDAVSASSTPTHHRPATSTTCATSPAASSTSQTSHASPNRPRYDARWAPSWVVHVSARVGEPTPAGAGPAARCLLGALPGARPGRSTGGANTQAWRTDVLDGVRAAELVHDVGLAGPGKVELVAVLPRGRVRRRAEDGVDLAVVDASQNGPRVTSAVAVS